MSKQLIDFNCPSNISTTGIINGTTSGILDLNSIKYQWAYNLWEFMLSNTWFPKEVDLTGDVSKYRELLPSEKFMYDRALAQLIFMDSLQTNNIVDNVNPWVTAPEVNICLVRQAFEEALHSQSYAVMVDSISMNTSEIYQMWKKDSHLFDKNKFILDIYEKYAKDCEHSDEAKIYMVVANQCLEGIYFYSGFAALYALARAGKMIGSAQMIRFIQRDEVTHLLLFANIFNTIKKENPDLFTQRVVENIRQMFREAVDLEITWGKYITSQGILGLNGELIESFVKWLGNERMKAIGYEKLYEEIPAECPIEWFNDFSKLNDMKTNFFEGNNANYSKGSIDINDF